jgi:hypothetical protein
VAWECGGFGEAVRPQGEEAGPRRGCAGACGGGGHGGGREKGFAGGWDFALHAKWQP